MELTGIVISAVCFSLLPQNEKDGFYLTEETPNHTVETDKNGTRYFSPIIGNGEITVKAEKEAETVSEKTTEQGQTETKEETQNESEAVSPVVE